MARVCIHQNEQPESVSVAIQDQIHEYLTNVRKPLQFVETTQIETLGDIIYNLISVPRKATKRVGGPQNYAQGRLRSIEDCYLLARHYIGNIAFNQVLRAVIYCYQGNWQQNNHITKSFCGTVQRWVHSSSLTKTQINTKLNEANLNAAVSGNTNGQNTNNMSDLIKEVESKLLKTKPIRLQGVLKNRKESLKDFIKKFFNKFNKENNTIYVDNKSLQTDINRRRSIDDIFNICKYYYPKCTLVEVSGILKGLTEEIDGFRSSYCNTINKRVFYLDETREKGVFDKTKKDQHGLAWRQWAE